MPERPHVSIDLRLVELSWQVRLWQAENPAEVTEWSVGCQEDIMDFIRGLAWNWATDVMTWFISKRQTEEIQVLGYQTLGLPRCPQCKGTGKYVGLLLIEDCDACYGTRLDLTRYDLKSVETVMHLAQ